MESFVFYSVWLLWCVQIFVLFSIVLLFRQFGLVYLNTGEGIAKDGPMPGHKKPDFEAYSLTSGRVVSSDEFDGRPMIVGFVEPSCKPCKRMIPEWNEAVRAYGDHVRFILVGLGGQEKIADMREQYRIQGDMLVDDTEIAFYRYKVRVTPFAVAVDQDGVVRDKGLCGQREHIVRLVTTLVRTPERGW